VTGPHRHGGDLAGLARTLELPADCHDFSVNTHPFGPHPGAAAAARKALDHMERYPDPAAESLRAAIAAAHGLPEACIVPGNGAAELIDLLPRALGVTRALVVTPAFGEYRDAVARAGGAVIPVARERIDSFPTGAVVAAIARHRPQAVFVCSPNNPTGERLADADFQAVHAACGESTLLVLDEAFVEYSGGSRMDEVTKLPNLVVLRSLTKFFGLAGLRVGYLAAAPPVAGRVAALRPPWTVNGPAAAAGMACLADPDYVDAQRQRVVALRQPFADALSALGLAPLPSDANFLLCRLPEGVSADHLFPALARDGFVVRHCGSFGLGDRYIRLRVHRPEVNAAFIKTLARHLPCS